MFFETVAVHLGIISTRKLTCPRYMVQDLQHSPSKVWINRQTGLKRYAIFSSFLNSKMWEYHSLSPDWFQVSAPPVCCHLRLVHTNIPVTTGCSSTTDHSHNAVVLRQTENDTRSHLSHCKVYNACWGKWPWVNRREAGDRAWNRHIKTHTPHPNQPLSINRSERLFCGWGNFKTM